MNKKTELIVALDFDRLEEVEKLVIGLGDRVSWYKVGMQLYTRYGPEIIARIKNKKKKVFLDLKFHDIPNTVSKAVLAASDMGVDMMNVHASGGRKMMEGAAESLLEVEAETLLIAVTVLTSMDSAAHAEIGCHGSINERVGKLALLAKQSGLKGVVSSARETDAIRRNCGEDFVLVVPGIRPLGTSHEDQKRVTTPAEAARSGIQYIVVGRPVTKSENPIRAAHSILDELDLNS